jgi:hypothetical protein
MNTQESQEMLSVIKNLFVLVRMLEQRLEMVGASHYRLIHLLAKQFGWEQPPEPEPMTDISSGTAR